MMKIVTSVGYVGIEYKGGRLSEAEGTAASRRPLERIREEIRAQKTPRGAIATGFNKAFWTIMDAKITTLITALVLFEYGTGPIKGFAVTLSIGVVTSVFSALVLTRLMFAVYPGNRTVESLSI